MLRQKFRANHLLGDTWIVQNKPTGWRYWLQPWDKLNDPDYAPRCRKFFKSKARAKRYAAYLTRSQGEIDYGERNTRLQPHM